MMSSAANNTAKISVSVQPGPFDAKAKTEDLLEGLVDVGAVVSFVGICRSDGGRLAALEIEHYPDMAEAEIRRVAETAAANWPIRALGVTHRTGLVPVGDEIVVVVAASEHREAAFHAAEFLMDFLKTSAPFWKKEHLAGGGEGNWIEGKASDAASADRWSKRTGSSQ